MALLNGLSFAGGNLQVRSTHVGVNAVASTDNPKTGTYSLKCTGNIAETSYILAHTIDSTNGNTELPNSTIDTMYYEFDFCIGDADDDQFFAVHTSLGAVKLRLELDSSNYVKMYQRTTGTVLGTSASPLSLDTYYRIGVKCGRGVNAPYELTIDGASEFSGTSSLLPAKPAYCSLGVQTRYKSSTYTFYYDNVIVDDAQFNGVLHSSNGGVPDANGSHTGWVGDYADVDDIPIATGSKIYATKAADKESSYCVDPTSLGVASGATIAFIRCDYFSYSSAGSGTLVKLGAREGSTEWWTTTGFLPHATAFEINSFLSSVNPNTSAAWETSDFPGSFQMLLEYSTAGPAYPECCDYHYSVFYVPVESSVRRKIGAHAGL